MTSLRNIFLSWTISFIASKHPFSAGYVANPIGGSTPILNIGADLEAWKNGYTNCPKETPPMIISCKVPQDFPAGTYFRNGHGRFVADDGAKIAHMFDGDGLVNAITFDPENHPNQLLFRNRFVRTKGYQTDILTKTMSARGVFGTMRSGGVLNNAFRLDCKNVANTNVLYSSESNSMDKKGKLYALWEGGRPHALDPLTLETDVAGESTLHGILEKEKEFSAHPRWDPENKVWINFGSVVNPIDNVTKIRLFELDSKMKVKRKDDISFVFKGLGVIHDFIITKNWHVFVHTSAEIDQNASMKALLGLGSFAGALNFSKGCSHIFMIPRAKLLKEGKSSEMDVETDSRIISIPIDKMFAYHLSNGYETPNKELVFEVLQAENVSLDLGHTDKPVWEIENMFDHVYPTKLVQYVVDIENKSLSETIPPKVLSTRTPEFPVIPKDLSSHKHKFIYCVGAHMHFVKFRNTKKLGPPGCPPGSIMKINTDFPDKNEVYSFQPHEFPGEVAFAAKDKKDAGTTKGEDSGYLVVFVVNGKKKTTELHMFDVEGEGSLENGPISKVMLPTFIPHGLHGSFFPGVTFDFTPYSKEKCFYERGSCP